MSVSQPQPKGKKMSDVKNGTSLKVAAGATDDVILSVAHKAIDAKSKAAAKRGRDWFGTVTVRIEGEDRPVIVKVFSDGIVLYRPTAIKERVVRVSMGKTKAL